MFQEHCTRAHIECKLRLNNSFVSDFRRNSRALPQPRYQFSLFLLPLSNGAFFTENVLRLMGFFFPISWNLQGGKVELKIIYGIVSIICTYNFCESDYMVNSDILFLYKKLSIVSICNCEVCKCNVKNNNILQNKIKFDCPNLWQIYNLF